MEKYKNLLAHYDKENPTKQQFLLEHLLNVTNNSKALGASVKLENSCQLIGLFHDFGKKEDKFQSYIKGEYTGRVDHSSAGGIILGYIEKQVYAKYEVNNLLESEGLKHDTWDLYGEILKYPILAHHGLYDIIDSKFNYRTGLRINIDKNDKRDFINRNTGFLELLNHEYTKINNKSIYDLYFDGFKEFIKVYETIKLLTLQANPSANKKNKIPRMKSLNFYYGALVRLLLSILKEADIYDSSNYYRGDKDKAYSQKELNFIWDEMGQSIEVLYDQFNENPQRTDLDIIRTNLANEIYDFSQKHSKGAFKLDMPVGSGKTYAALRYAIGNANQFKKTRVLYTTAFLSVLEQNASSIRDALGDDYILEHHSNVIQDHDGSEAEEDQKDYEILEYLKESWESPVILTTLVQLSNTMFKHKASNIRRFSKLINSVIIIDEIQSLPTKAIFNFNLMTNFLTQIMNCTIVHATATPPSLDNRRALTYPCIYGNDSEESSIIKPIENREIFSRVEYYSLLGKDLNKSLNNEELVEHIKVQLQEEMSALIVLNTKGAVANLYESLKKDEKLAEEDITIFYLTTNQCPKHRLEIITNVKEQLKSIRDSEGKRKIICVSTKLVEAGVDIDFDVVYRSLAGIDSVIQCGGRCNREGRKTSKGKLFIFKYANENLSYLPEIRKQREAAETALRIMSMEGPGHGEMDIEKACDFYFQKLYLNEGTEGRNLEFPIGNSETILNLLTNNPIGAQNYETKQGEKPGFKLKQGFKTAAIEFDLIKESTISVIVQYKNEDEIEELYNAIESHNYYGIKKMLQKLQPYTISIRNVAEYGNYISRELDDEILILSKEAYHEDVGLIKGELQSLVF